MLAAKFFYRFLTVLAFYLGVAGAPALAGISYSIEQPHASAGETIHINAVVFNDTNSIMDWTPPENLVLQWRDAAGTATRSLAYLDSVPGRIQLPVNTFAKTRWRAVVPSAITGLQALNIEGEATLLALDTTPYETGRISGSAAAVPVVDAGAAAQIGDTDPPLPDNIVAASSGFNKFRNAISVNEPIYFVMGDKGGRHARYQVSFKYRLFSPDDSSNPSFIDHLYLGYTQTALWDLQGDSHPFIDTSYKPSLFWRKDALFQTQNKQWFLGLAAGVEHESNGKAGADSRSINFAYIQPKFNYRFDGGSTLTFAPRVKSYFKIQDNPDYRNYAGNVDWTLRWAQDNGLVLSGLYRHGSQHRTLQQIDAAWPLHRTPLNMNGYLHFQYFKGYGETLLGYRHNSDSQFRIGLSLAP